MLHIFFVFHLEGSISLQNKIWNLLDRSTILPKFIYGKEGKPTGPTAVLPVRVHGPALILKTVQLVLLYHKFINFDMI